MNVHPRMNLEAMCRVCLDMQVHNEMVAIFGSNGEETAVSLKIGQCSAIEVRVFVVVLFERAIMY